MGGQESVKRPREGSAINMSLRRRGSRLERLEMELYPFELLNIRTGKAEQIPVHLCIQAS
jgi:hypothetical protein